MDVSVPILEVALLQSIKQQFKFKNKGLHCLKSQSKVQGQVTPELQHGVMSRNQSERIRKLHDEL